MAALSRRRLLGLCGAGLAATACRAPAPASHERNRVAFEAPAVEAALWFVDRYFDYFASGEAGLGAWLDSLDGPEREFVLAMAQTLTWTWIAHERRALVGESVAAVARQAITVVRRKTLNQLEVKLAPGHADDLDTGPAFCGDPHFAAGVFARLVRGASNCEGQNHLVQAVMEAALEPGGWRPRRRYGLISLASAGHEIIRVHGPGLAQPLFVDGWSNLPPFVLDPARPVADAPTLAELGPEPALVVPGAASRAPEPAEVYAGAGPGVSVVMVPGRDAPARGVSYAIKAPRLDDEALERIEDPRRLFLFARVLHLYDDPRAEELYYRVLGEACPGRFVPATYLCRASKRFVASPRTLEASGAPLSPG